MCSTFSVYDENNEEPIYVVDISDSLMHLSGGMIEYIIHNIDDIILHEDHQMPIDMYTSVPVRRFSGGVIAVGDERIQHHHQTTINVDARSVPRLQVL